MRATAQAYAVGWMNGREEVITGYLLAISTKDACANAKRWGWGPYETDSKGSSIPRSVKWWSQRVEVLDGYLASLKYETALKIATMAPRHFRALAERNLVGLDAASGGFTYGPPLNTPDGSTKALHYWEAQRSFTATDPSEIMRISPTGHGEGIEMSAEVYERTLAAANNLNTMQNLSRHYYRQDPPRAPITHYCFGEHQWRAGGSGGQYRCDICRSQTYDTADFDRDEGLADWARTTGKYASKETA